MVGDHIMKSIHTDANGKYAVAVYECELPLFNEFNDEWIENLFPRSFGVNITHEAVTRTSTHVRWMTLIANTKQTTRKDIINAIVNRTGWSVTDPRIHVTVRMAVPQCGMSTNPGSPREGAVRIVKNALHGKGITAR